MPRLNNACLRHITKQTPRVWYGLITALAMLATGCSQTGAVKDSEDKAQEGYVALEDLYIVDCLLPGQVRRLGNMSYLSPRRATRTTTADCRIRGGEYVDYDRADYRSALKVWLPLAEQGDPEAQNYVGEIFEKGLGQEPDFQSARQWYERAANQNYSRAQVNLGYLYEKGLGVPSNVTVALNWYRKASGITDDALVLNSQAQKALQESERKLNAQLASARVQSQFLEQQIATLQEKSIEQEQLAKQTPAAVDTKQLETAKQEIAALTELYQRASAEREDLEAQLQSMALSYRSVGNETFLSPQELEGTKSRILEDVNFGRYFALIIGNEDYVFLDDLRSPVHDGQELQALLEQKYGFTTLFIPNATEKNILNTINDFYEQIGENDNLLIYYAGHGNLSRRDESRAERGYWLPVDASKDNIANWINNAVISDHLDRLRARSVLVISDSCYAGYLGSEQSPFLFGVSGGETAKAIKAGLARRARVVISSGGVKPVLDGSDTAHSVFAGSLLEALQTNEGALRDSNLFAQLSVNVRKRSAIGESGQIPEMKPVREAGHEGGAFYFIPVQ